MIRSDDHSEDRDPEVVNEYKKTVGRFAVKVTSSVATPSAGEADKNLDVAEEENSEEEKDEEAVESAESSEMALKDDGYQ